MTRKIKAAIINVTGYAGAELARILYLHPNVELACMTGRSAVGKYLGEVYPHLSFIDMKIVDEVTHADIVFSAMPHKDSAEKLIPLINRGLKVIDISADFRLKNPTDYPRWYQFNHPAPELLEKAVYGLPELYRELLKKAQIVANPGCYPTSAILALVPAISDGLIEPDIVIDSKSGISGAGRTLSLNTHYPEATENVMAYSLNGHRHLPEIVQELTLAGRDFCPCVTFIPHLIPMSRGIISTCYARLRANKTISSDKILEIYRSFYRYEPFVKVVDYSPATKHTIGSNFCLLHPFIDVNTSRLIVISCIDNLVKGAAGQAVQNMNIMFGLGEEAGLEHLPLYP